MDIAEYQLTTSLSLSPAETKVACHPLCQCAFFRLIYCISSKQTHNPSREMFNLSKTPVKSINLQEIRIADRARCSIASPFPSPSF